MPTSVTSFAHRLPGRQRQDSISSFTYFQEEDELPEWSDEEAVVDDSDDEEDYANGQFRDLEAGSIASARRKSSARSEVSADEPLIRHAFAGSRTMDHAAGGSFSQKLYIMAEDLTMVVAGFSTSLVGYSIYVAICIVTAGLGYLLFRWLPRWRMRLIGRPAPLRNCRWVVIEVSGWLHLRCTKSTAKKDQNQWGEFTIHYISNEEYGYPLSTVLGATSKEALNGYNDDDDPVLENLRFLDYRYMRLLYHPVEDKFVLNDTWWDPQWTDVKALRIGLDSEERDIRDQVFGKNMIEIHRKGIPQLLLDEVSGQTHM